MELIGLIYFFIVLFINVEYDVKVLKEKYITNHWIRFIIRIILVVPSTILINVTDITVLNLTTTFFLLGAIWWIIFDIYLNLRRGLDWNYIGTESAFDYIFIYFSFNQNPFILQWEIKRLLLFLSFILFIYVRLWLDI